MFNLHGSLLNEALAEVAFPGTYNAGPPIVLGRSPEEEAKFKAIGSSICQTYITTAMIGVMASRNPDTVARWQREMARGNAIQSLFTDPTKWEIVANLIWPAS